MIGATVCNRWTVADRLGLIVALASPMAAAANRGTRPRGALKNVSLSLHRIEVAAAAGQFDTAADEYRAYYDQTFSMAMALSRGAEAFSLFNPALHEAHNTERRRMLRTRMPPPSH